MKTFTLLLFISIYSLSAQNNILDYIVTSQNDTLFGAIQKDQLIQFGKDQTLVKTDITNAKSIRKNEIVYHRINENFKADKKKDTKFYTDYFVSETTYQSDFIVNKLNDTLLGTIKSPLFGPKYIKSESTKFKICTDDSDSYQKNNVTYELKTLGSPILSTEKDVFLKRLYKGKVSLYTYKVLRNDVGTVKPKTFYIIEKNKVLHLISNSNYKQDLVDLLIDDLDLSDNIFNDFYSIENIYLIVKAYDINQ
jgi:hypothetical protein